MQRIKKTRKVTRGAFTRALTAIQAELKEQSPQLKEIQVNFALLKEKASELEELNQNMIEEMFTQNSSDQEIDEEVQNADEYRKKYQLAKIEVSEIERRLQQCNTAPSIQTGEHPYNNPPGYDNKRSFKLPKIELKKFNGDVKEWLQFWSQFKHIHEDRTIAKEDKFQYLLQAIVPDTRASEFVNSYPPTADNYDKVIDGLKGRFGKNELLVEVYVRELLKLVLNNTITPRGKISLTSIYDKLETHIRSLESLGVTTDTCAAMLYPLVESSLPEELLRAWQRHTSTTIQIAAREPGENVEAVRITTTPKDRLTNLMAFLQAEVENEERITMAVSGFSLEQERTTTKNKQKIKIESSKGVATASALLATKEGKIYECIFCNGKHDSSQCEKARNLSLEERFNIVKQKNTCFICLKIGHGRKFCRYNNKCAWCSKRHVLLMCRGMTADRPTMKNPPDEAKQKTEESSLANLSLSTEVFLPTLRVKMRNQDKESVVRAVLDTGSHRSYVLNQTAQKLVYEEVGQQAVIHLLFGGTRSEPQEHKGYRVRLTSLDGSYACNFVALGQETICQNIPGVRRGPWIRELSHKGIHLTDIEHTGEPISLLIGADIIGKLLTGNLQELGCGATAIETRLGWTVMGKILQETTTRIDSALLTVSLFNQEANVSDLWSLDTLGITDPIQTKTKEAHQVQVKEHFRQTLTVNETGRYEVYLPWKESHPPLSDNKDMAIKRLEINTEKLKADDLYEDYCQVLEEWETEGIIERVPIIEVNEYGHYLPHRRVVKGNSTTRLRPVFDASARSGKNSPSLNQCLEVGPNLIELIPTILLRFREKKIGVVADIKRAFLQISVSPKERDVLRFLWWNKKDPDKLEIYRHCRVVFGVKSSPFLLGATIELHLERLLQQVVSEEQRHVIKRLRKSFYVDNCATSVDTNADLQLFMVGSTAAMASGGFHLRGWEHSDPTQTYDASPVLGLSWNRGLDTLSLSKTTLEESLPNKVTKRNILSVAQKIFDPIGLVCPVLLRPKLLLQRLWSTERSWDAEVDVEVRDAFEKWHEQLHLLKELQVPRWVFENEHGESSTSFHVFVDASKEAYAAALFARTEFIGGVKVQLIQAKTRVAPLKGATIPRLELLAATIGTRMLTFALDALGRPEAEKYLWSDSTTVLSWIKEEKQWATFVWNRVKEIRQFTKPEQWHHLPGTMNPADLPSRGCCARQLLESRWWEGPKWLQEPCDRWPSNNYVADIKEVNREVKKSTTKLKESEGPTRCEVTMSNTYLQSLTDTERHWYLRGSCTYPKLLRVMGWILRFIARCRKRYTRHSFGDLSLKEINAAELTLLRLIQEESFEGVDDIRIKCLNVFKDTAGVIRLKTLISNREDQYGFRYPIVLEPRHPLVRRLIRHKHEELHHAGIQIVMNNLREQVWILSSRRTVRSVLSECMVCKRCNVKKIDASPSTLPEERIRDAAAFEVSGVDVAGPLYLKDGKKAWICLFTCAVYRAIHLELTTSLSTEAFLDVFRRFVARRGRPSIMFSDNGTNFLGTTFCEGSTGER